MQTLEKNLSTGWKVMGLFVDGIFAMKFNYIVVLVSWSNQTCNKHALEFFQSQGQWLF